MLHALRRLSPQPKRTIAIATILAISMLAAMITVWVAAPVEAKPNPAKPTIAAATLEGATAGTPVDGLAPQDGGCDVGDVCLYYTGLDSSRYDTAHNDPSLHNNHFISTGNGKGALVANNAVTVWNRDPSTPVFVCTGPGGTGTCGSVLPNVAMTLSSTYINNVESIYWGDSSN